MKITDELVDYLADLSRLEITAEERHAIATELDIIIEHVDTLSGLDTGEINAMSHVLEIKNVFREDQVKPSSDREMLLSQAPERDEESFVVPKTVE